MALERKTGLAPISPRRLAEFGGRMPHSSLEKPGATPTAPKAKRYKDTGPDALTVQRVWARDRGHCTCCGDWIPPNGRRGYEWCISHRKLRAHGVDNSMSNLMLTCGNGSWGCESEIHRGPERARQAGWMLKSTEVPAEVPLEHSQHGFVLLLDDGTWRRVEAEFIPAVEVSEPW